MNDNPTTPTGATAGVDLDKQFDAAIDAAYPIPDTPHTSVMQRANDSRAAFTRGWQAARRAQPRVAEQADEQNANFPHCLNRTAFISDLTYQMYLAEIAGYTQQAAPEAPAGFEEAIGAWLSARDYWQDDENEHVKAAWGNVLKLAAPAPATPAAPEATVTDYGTPTAPQAASQQITDPELLEVGREYWLLDKRTGTAKVSECRADHGCRYFDNRIWAEPINNQAMERWDIFGPLPVRKFDGAPQAATTASASDGSIYEAVSRRADPEGHAEAMAQVDSVLGRAPAPSREADELRAAAAAVVARWDSPKWKDEPHTAEFINRLRAALTRAPLPAQAGKVTPAATASAFREQREAIHREAEQCQIAQAAGVARGAVRWSKEPPAEQADYWHWDGDEDHAPMIYHVMWSGTAKKCFLSIGQYDITCAIWCDEFGGYWMKIAQPSVRDVGQSRTNTSGGSDE